MMGRMTERKGGGNGSREGEDRLRHASGYLLTHSRRGHGDPGEDHLGDAFDCCFLWDTDTEGTLKTSLLNAGPVWEAEILTVEWPSLLPFSSVTAMPFRISL